MDKPSKPYPTFPLTPHPSGTWCKKVNGKLYHFGPWSDPDAALAKWEREATSIRAGKPPAAGDESLKALAARWLADQLDLVHRERLTWGHYTMCRRSAVKMLDSLGRKTTASDLSTDDFARFGRSLEDSGLGAKALRRYVRCVLAFLNHVESEEWTAKPIRCGKRFSALANAVDDRQPTAKARTPDDVQTILTGVDSYIADCLKRGEIDVHPLQSLKAAILLALNGGYGGTDLATLPRVVVDLDAGVIDYRRQKTRMERMVPLWPETVAALRAMWHRPKDGHELVFVTKRGQPWCRELPRNGSSGAVEWTSVIDNFQQAYAKLLKRLGMKRSGCGFYELRHTHAEVADTAGDPHACRRIMGHQLPGSADPYIRVTFDRLKHVTDHVHAVLFKGFQRPITTPARSS